MRNRPIGTTTGRGREAWAVFTLLLVAVLVPTAAVLWFMSEAMRNQEAAIRGRLEEVYRGQLLAAQGGLDAHWKGKVAAFSAVAPDESPAEIFAKLVSSQVCDSAIIYDGSGRISYPEAAEAKVVRKEEDWLEAERLEYTRRDLVAAAQRYAAIAEEANSVELAAQALQAQARCLARTGEKEKAIEVLADLQADDRYRYAEDEYGRFIAPNAHLLVLELMGGPSHRDFQKTASLLAERLNDYRTYIMPSNQRRFLMREVRRLMPGPPKFPTLEAEDIGADYVESGPPGPGTRELAPTPLRGIWQLSSPDGSLLALFREDRIVEEMASFIDAAVSVTGGSVRLLLPTAEKSGPEPFLAIPGGEYLPDWRLALYLEGPDPFAGAAKREMVRYLWAGLLVILAITIMAVFVARYVGRQMRLTDLKNDLIATVSHELKTPLSSIRALVDTLLEGRYRDERQVREYLDLIAKENVRLSRLIDNFLTFSRMERNKKAFQFGSLRAEEVVRQAREAVQERFVSGGYRLDVAVQPGLPPIVGDRDALTTVLLNLLDNAYKYSKNDKRVSLRAYSGDGCVCLEVEDNGIGLSRKAAKRVFDRFYQADQTLSRKGAGVGLGLSIVKFIVGAHGGLVSVESQPGKGSRFTVRLPVAGVEAPSQP